MISVWDIYEDLSDLHCSDYISRQNSFNRRFE